MGSVFADIAPFALGIALSPFPVVPAILLLFCDRARIVSAAFVGAFVLGVAAVTAVFVVVSELIEQTDYPPAWASWARVVFGVALTAYAIKVWFSRSPDDEPPAWMASIGSSTPGQSARLGLLLSGANPKVVVLAAGGGLALGSAGPALIEAALLVVGFAALASVGVALPLAMFLVAGERILGPLGTARDWLQRHNTAITAVVIGLIGILLIAKGAAGL